MPNHCTNHLQVSGDTDEVKRFRHAITQGELQEHEHFRILDNLLPTPDELRNTPSGSFSDENQKIVDEQNKSNIAKFGHKDWYEWNCANYGSKWSDYEVVIERDDAGELDLCFVSAWSPVIQGIVRVSSQFPTLEFVLTYDEGGMAFMGACAIQDGELRAHIEEDYPEMTEDESNGDRYEQFYDRVLAVLKDMSMLCKLEFGMGELF